jgi:subtilisin family serine protease
VFPYCCWEGAGDGIGMVTQGALSRITGSSPARAGVAPFDLVRLRGLMAATEGDAQIIVALIDGPVAVGHSSLAGDRIRSVAGDEGAGCPTPEGAACNHGTFVAGVLHAKRDSTTPGICPGCTLLLRPIFGDTAAVGGEELPSASGEQLASAILEVIAAGARVINLSVGLIAAPLRTERVLDEALQEAARRGVVVVAAAGNQGVVGGSAITRHPWVIPVVACDPQGLILAPSNLGASIGRFGVAAPGHNITSLSGNGGYTKMSGTSVAVPFVSGAVALLWSLFPGASATRLRLAVLASPYRRRSVSPPLLDAATAHQTLTQSSTKVSPL